MSTDEPVNKKPCLDPQSVFREHHDQDQELQCQLEQCYSTRCLCDLNKEDVHSYVTRNFSTLSDTQLPDQSSILLFLSFVTWLCQTFHDQLSSGFICSSLHSLCCHLLSRDDDLMKILELLQSNDENIQYSASQALISLLPLSHCGSDFPSQFSNLFLTRFKEDIIKDYKPATKTNSLLDVVAPGESAGLDDFFFDEPSSSSSPSSAQSSTSSTENLRYKSLLVSVMAGFVTHADKSSEEPGAVNNERCARLELEEDTMCQETQVKCLVIKTVDPVWSQLTQYLTSLLSQPRVTHQTEILLCDGFRLWQSLISVRANLSFVESRAFSADLETCLPRLTGALPASVWSQVLETVSECLCYGTTLGLQSIPPQEPCNVAHTIIR